MVCSVLSGLVHIECIHEVLVVNGRVTWLMGVGRCYSYSGGER